MKVLRAAVLGRCMGVRRATDMALAAAAETGAEGVFTLGPLIHNPQAVAELEAAGVRALSESELDARVRGTTVVIRAHGVAPEMREKLVELGARAVDATCPRVLASQRVAARAAARGRTVIIAGEKGHGEVVGISGCAPGSLVAGSAEEARRLAPEGPITLIAQTTIRAEEYRAIRAELEARFPDLEVVDSICPCTEERLEALAELCAEVDAIVIVGGRNSANAARLLAAARERRPAWLVETAAELPDEVFGYERVGLSAGASTPDRLVDEVQVALQAGRARVG